MSCESFVMDGRERDQYSLDLKNGLWSCECGEWGQRGDLRSYIHNSDILYLCPNCDEEIDRVSVR